MDEITRELKREARELGKQLAAVPQGCHTMESCRALCVTAFMVSNSLEGFNTVVWKDLLADCRNAWAKALSGIITGRKGEY